MKNWIHILFCFWSFAGFAQEYDSDKMNQSDSLCALEETHPDKKEYIFEVTDTLEGYLPCTKKYVVYSRNNLITAISCEYLLVRDSAPIDGGSIVSYHVCLREGSVLGFGHSDEYVCFDTTISNLSERIKQPTCSLPWTLSEAWLNGELIWYMSNGHGITETDYFDPKEHCKNVVEMLKEEIRKKYPNLK